MSVRRCLAALALTLATPALAVPTIVPHQGRLVDSTGVALSGPHDLSFTLYDAPSGGSPAWSETLEGVVIDNGFYAVSLGSETPLDRDILTGDPLYLGITLDSGTELPERITIQSVPYAVRANVATDVKGGTVDVSSVSINGNEVIASDGTLTAPLDWSSLTGVPADVADGDALDALSCDDGQLAAWSAGDGAWACADDAQLTEAEVEGFVTNGALDFAAGSTVGGSAILTESSSVAWSQITGAPADQDTTYQAGPGLTLDGTTNTFAVDAGADAAAAIAAVEGDGFVRNTGPAGVNIRKMTISRGIDSVVRYTAADGTTDEVDVAGIAANELRVGAAGRIAVRAGVSGATDAVMLFQIEGASLNCTWTGGEDDTPRTGFYWATDGGNSGVNVAAWGNDTTSTFMLSREGIWNLPIAQYSGHAIVCF